MSSIQKSDSVIICFWKITFIFWVSTHKNLKNHKAKVSEALHWPHFVSWCTLCRDATETASALFFLVLLEKERKGLCKHHEPCHAQLKTSRNNKCSENWIKSKQIGNQLKSTNNTQTKLKHRGNNTPCGLCKKHIKYSFSQEWQFPVCSVWCVHVRACVWICSFLSFIC